MSRLAVVHVKLRTKRPKIMIVGLMPQLTNTIGGCVVCAIVIDEIVSLTTHLASQIVRIMVQVSDVRGHVCQQIATLSPIDGQRSACFVAGIFVLMLSVVDVLVCRCGARVVVSRVSLFLGERKMQSKIFNFDAF